MLSRYGLAESVEELEAEYAGFFKMLYTYGEGPKKVELYSDQEQGHKHDPKLQCSLSLIITSFLPPRMIIPGSKRGHMERKKLFSRQQERGGK